MDKRTRERLEERAEILKTIGSPVRLFVLEQLAKTERCVSELVQHAGVSEPTLSYHLKKMKHAGIVNSRRQKKLIYYFLENRAALSVRADVEYVLVGKTSKLESLCRTKTESMKKERRRPGGRNILKGRIF